MRKMDTYSYDELGEVLVLQLGMVEKLLRDSRDEGEELQLVQLFVGRHVRRSVSGAILGQRAARTASPQPTLR